MMNKKEHVIERKCNRRDERSVAITSVIETVIDIDEIDNNLALLRIHHRKAIESLENIENKIKELEEYKKLIPKESV